MDNDQGTKLPDVRRETHRPTASVLIVAAMLGMFAILNAAEVWETFREVAPLVSVAYYLVLTRWARSE